MASIKLYFDLRKEKNNQTFPLKLKLFHKDKARYISLRLFFKKNQWVEAHNKVRSSYPKSFEVNASISRSLFLATSTLEELRGKIELMTIDELKKIICKKLDGLENESNNLDSQLMLFDFTECIIARFRKAKKLGTAKIYETCISVISRFIEQEDIPLSSVTFSFLCDFEADCLKRGIKVNSISVYLRTLRAIVNRAIDEGLLDNGAYPFRKFKIKKEKTQKRAISKEEIFRIMNLPLEKGSRLWHSRNYFIFIFNLSGMNFIDLAYLKRGNIQNGRVTYRRIKTGKLYNIRLTEKALEILKLYTTKGKKNNLDYVFPILTKEDQKNHELERKRYEDRRKAFNKDLKGIAEKCEIKINLTSYVSRHSWASIAKFSGVAPAIIGESLGHSDLKTTETYLANFDHNVLDEANELIVS